MEIVYLYCAFSYLFMVGRIAKMYKTNDSGLGKTSLMLLLLAPISVPFYLGSK